MSLSRHRNYCTLYKYCRDCLIYWESQITPFTWKCMLVRCRNVTVNHRLVLWTCANIHHMCHALDVMSPLRIFMTCHYTNVTLSFNAFNSVYIYKEKLFVKRCHTLMKRVSTLDKLTGTTFDLRQTDRNDFKMWQENVTPPPHPKPRK